MISAVALMLLVLLSAASGYPDEITDVDGLSCFEQALTDAVFDGCRKGGSRIHGRVTRAISRCHGQAQGNQTSSSGLRVMLPSLFSPWLLPTLDRFSQRYGVPLQLDVRSPVEILQAIKDEAQGVAPEEQSALWLHTAGYTQELADEGLLADLSALVTSNAGHGLAWANVAQLYRLQIATYMGRTVSVPLDGGMGYMFSRTDVLGALGLEPPQSWTELLDFVAHYRQRQQEQQAASSSSAVDFGLPPYAICMPQGVACKQLFNLQSIWTSISQTSGAEQGIHFDTTTFEPLVASPAAREAFRIMSHLLAAAAPPEPGEACTHGSLGFARGRCAVVLAGLVPQLMHFVDAAANATVAQSSVRVTRLPGSEVVWLRGDRSSQQQKQELVPCTRDTCPFATHVTCSLSFCNRTRLVNFAPASLLWTLTGGINARAPVLAQLLAWEILVFLGSNDRYGPSEPVSPLVAIAPVREQYLFTEDAISVYMRASYDSGMMGEALQVMRSSSRNHPNRGWPLRMAGASVYNNVIQDLLMDIMAGKVVTTEAGRADALGGVGLLGLDAALARAKASLAAYYMPQSHRARYLASLGILGGVDARASGPAYNLNGSSVNNLTTKLAASICGGAVFLLLAVIILALALHRSRMVRHHVRGGNVLHPPHVNEPAVLVVTDIESSTLLWEDLDADVMAASVQLHHAVLRRLLVRHEGYESATEGDSFIVSFHSAYQAVAFGTELQTELLKQPWPKELLEHQVCKPVYTNLPESFPFHRKLDGLAQHFTARSYMESSNAFTDQQAQQPTPRASFDDFGLTTERSHICAPSSPDEGSLRTHHLTALHTSGLCLSPEDGANSSSADEHSQEPTAATGVTVAAVSLPKARLVASSHTAGSSSGGGWVAANAATATAATPTGGGLAPDNGVGPGSSRMEGGSSGGALTLTRRHHSCVDAARPQHPLGRSTAGRSRAAAGAWDRLPAWMSGGSQQRADPISTTAGDADAGSSVAAPRRTLRMPPELLLRADDSGTFADILGCVTAADSYSSVMRTAASGCAPSRNAALKTTQSSHHQRQQPRAQQHWGVGEDETLGAHLRAACELDQKQAERERNSACSSLMFRGLRVRVGISFVTSLAPVELQYNTAAARMVLGGPCVVACKALADMAHGGQVLLSCETEARLREEVRGHGFEPHGGVTLLTLGTYERMPPEAAGALGEGGCSSDVDQDVERGLAGAAAKQGDGCTGNTSVQQQPATLWSVLWATTPSLTQRLTMWPPLRVPESLTVLNDLYDAPMGRVSYVVVQVPDARSLLAWNTEVARESLQLFQSTALRLLRRSHARGFQVAVREDQVHVAFVAAAAAVRFAEALRYELLAAPWPQALLNHELGEPLEATSAADLLPNSIHIASSTPGWGGAAGAASPSSRKASHRLLHSPLTRADVRAGSSSGGPSISTSANWALRLANLGLRRNNTASTLHPPPPVAVAAGPERTAAGPAASPLLGPAAPRGPPRMTRSLIGAAPPPPDVCTHQADSTGAACSEPCLLLPPSSDMDGVASPQWKRIGDVGGAGDGRPTPSRRLMLLPAETRLDGGLAENPSHLQEDLLTVRSVNAVADDWAQRALAAASSPLGRGPSSGVVLTRYVAVTSGSDEAGPSEGAGLLPVCGGNGSIADGGGSGRLSTGSNSSSSSSSSSSSRRSCSEGMPPRQGTASGPVTTCTGALLDVASEQVEGNVLLETGGVLEVVPFSPALTLLDSSMTPFVCADTKAPELQRTTSVSASDNASSVLRSSLGRCSLQMHISSAHAIATSPSQQELRHQQPHQSAVATVFTSCGKAFGQQHETAPESVPSHLRPCTSLPSRISQLPLSRSTGGSLDHGSELHSHVYQQQRPAGEASARYRGRDSSHCGASDSSSGRLTSRAAAPHSAVSVSDEQRAISGGVAAAGAGAGGAPVVSTIPESAPLQRLLLRGLRMRAGIATGRAEWQASSSTHTLAYSGQPVLVASKLARLATSGQVLCDSATHNSCLVEANCVQLHVTTPSTAAATAAATSRSSVSVQQQGPADGSNGGVLPGLRFSSVVGAPMSMTARSAKKKFPPGAQICSFTGGAAAMESRLSSSQPFPQLGSSSIPRTAVVVSPAVAWSPLPQPQDAFSSTLSRRGSLEKAPRWPRMASGGGSPPAPAGLPWTYIARASSTGAVPATWHTAAPTDLLKEATNAAAVGAPSVAARVQSSAGGAFIGRRAVASRPQATTMSGPVTAPYNNAGARAGATAGASTSGSVLLVQQLDSPLLPVGRGGARNLMRPSTAKAAVAPITQLPPSSAGAHQPPLPQNVRRAPSRLSMLTTADGTRPGPAGHVGITTATLHQSSGAFTSAASACAATMTTGALAAGDTNSASSMVITSTAAWRRGSTAGDFNNPTQAAAAAGVQLGAPFPPSHAGGQQAGLHAPDSNSARALPQDDTSPPRLGAAAAASGQRTEEVPAGAAAVGSGARDGAAVDKTGGRGSGLWRPHASTRRLSGHSFKGGFDLVMSSAGASLAGGNTGSDGLHFKQDAVDLRLGSVAQPPLPETFGDAHAPAAVSLFARHTMPVGELEPASDGAETTNESSSHTPGTNTPVPIGVNSRQFSFLALHRQASMRQHPPGAGSLGADMLSGGAASLAASPSGLLLLPLLRGDSSNLHYDSASASERFTSARSGFGSGTGVNVVSPCGSRVVTDGGEGGSRLGGTGLGETRHLSGAGQVSTLTQQVRREVSMRALECSVGDGVGGRQQQQKGIIGHHTGCDANGREVQPQDLW